MLVYIDPTGFKTYLKLSNLYFLIDAIGAEKAYKIYFETIKVKNTFPTTEKGLSSDSEHPEPQKMRSRVEFKMKRL